MPVSKDKTKAKGYLAIIEQLRKDLDGGRYKPGDKLPSEKDLCGRFDASRSSVREALAALAYAGIVEARGGSGYYVIGNLPAVAKDQPAPCAAKTVVAVDGSWNIGQYKRALAAGADGFIVSADAQGQWTKHIRAIRQAANDLRLPVPILAEVATGMDIEDTVAVAASANVDAIIVRPGTGTEPLLTVRRLVEEKGLAISVLAWIDSPASGEVLLQVADGVILESAPAGSDSLPPMMHRAIALGKLMLLAVRTGEKPGAVVTFTDAANTAESAGFDGVVLSPAGINANNLANYIHLLRTKLKAVEDRLADRSEQRPAKIVTSPLANALCATAMQAVASSKAMAIVIPSDNGFTPRVLSKFRPPVPLLSVTPDARVARLLKLMWGVKPLLTQRLSRQEDTLDAAIRTAVRSECIGEGDVIVGVTSNSDVHNAPSSVTIAVVGDVVLRGQGIGGGIISGRVTLVRSLYNAKKSVADKIVVAPATDASHIKLIEQAAALIVEEGGLSSHAAVACLTLGKPVIVGANDATDLLLEDEQVTIDVSRGIVYRGWVNLV